MFLYYDMCRDIMICVDDIFNCKNVIMDYLSKFEYCILFLKNLYCILYYYLVILEFIGFIFLM